ncbi:hypothetical protein U1Q18_031976 [Sarracenia purpurea var. burkii]
MAWVGSKNRVLEEKLQEDFDPHFDNLVQGFHRTSAACYFHLICVLANANFIEVKQEKSYGEILLSRGANM